jgi:DNA-binding MarR family transcriptional regulator
MTTRQPTASLELEAGLPGRAASTAIASPCACTRVRRAARALTQLYDAALAPAGLTVAQYALMRTVIRLAEPTISVLALATGLDRSTLGRNLRLLAAAGFVDLAAGNDRRTRLVRVTVAGEAVLAGALPHWQWVQAEIATGLGPETRDQLYELLARIEDLARAMTDLHTAGEEAA